MKWNEYLIKIILIKINFDDYSCIEGLNKICEIFIGMFKINKIILLSLFVNVFIWIMINGVISLREVRLGLGIGCFIVLDEFGCIVFI